jgi:hypothetical protein
LEDRLGGGALAVRVVPCEDAACDVVFEHQPVLSHRAAQIRALPELGGVLGGVEPEGVLPLAEEAFEQQLGVRLALEGAHVQARGGAFGEALAAAPRRHARPVQPVPARRLALLGERVEVLEQLVPVFGADRLGVELHPPQRAGGVFDAHHHPVGGPRDLAALLAERAGDGERVVAHHVEPLGDALEQALSRVAYRAEAPVHHRGGVGDGRFEHVPETLVAEAHAEHRRLAEAQDVGAHAEVVPAVGASRTGGEHDRVEVPARQRPPGDHVVVHHDRLLAGGGGEQVEDVVGVGVVVVYEQGGHRPASGPRPANPCLPREA